MTKRDGQKGAAAVEFALCIFVLFPLLVGMLNYAYHLYIAINVVEAEHAGLVAAARTSGVGACTTTTAAATAGSTAVTTYFGLNSLSTKLSVVSTSSTPTCAILPVSPTWSMTLAVDYTPLIGRVMAWDPASPVSGKLRFTAKPLAMLGSP